MVEYSHEAMGWALKFLGIIILISLIIVFGNPNNHFWKEDYEKKVDWCEAYKPQFNISLDNENVAFCYGEWWEEYCKISYPEYCPVHNSSERSKND